MENIIINREEFYLTTGRILTNNRELLSRLVNIERLYDWGDEPSKETILQRLGLLKEQLKVIQNLTEELREHGIIKTKEI